MGKDFLNFQNLSFAYDSFEKDLFTDLSCRFDTGWTCVTGANGAGKSTLLMLAAGILKPVHGNITSSGHVIYCPQRTDNMPHHATDFIESTAKRSYRISGALNIKEEWLARWETLSHGERKRIQIGTALYLEPNILAIDEPTNHLDAVARKEIQKALKSFRGAGLLVSHDRELICPGNHTKTGTDHYRRTHKPS